MLSFYSARAQEPAKPAFEVASIKPSKPMTMGKVFIRMDADASMLRYSNVTLKDCIRTAYDVKDFQVQGPDWLGSERFDIVAKLPAGSSKDQIPEMLQSLLAERFKLHLHRERKEHAIYALVVGKNGAKLTPAEVQTPKPNESPKPPGDAMMMRMSPEGAHLKAPSATLSRLAEMISRFTERPVIDDTGIKGQYDFDLAFMPETMQHMPMMMRAPGPKGGGDPCLRIRPSSAPAPSTNLSSGTASNSSHARRRWRFLSWTTSRNHRLKTSRTRAVAMKTCAAHHFVGVCAIVCIFASALAASEHRGQVTFRGLPVPGATVTASRDGAKLATITDPQGLYSVPDLTDGSWMLDVEMFGFEPIRKTINVTPSAPLTKWELTMLPLDRLKAQIKPAKAPARLTARLPESRRAEPESAENTLEQASEGDLTQRAADGLLINGSVNNGAASPFAQAPAFGNNRFGARRLYNGGIGFTVDNSALDARPFSLTGQETAKAAYNRMTGMLTFGGPLQIPHLFTNGPNFFVGYQWTRNNDATTASALMPTVAQRSGEFAQPILDPLTAEPFPGSAIPQSRISGQARSLLGLYPFPNHSGDSAYNYQIALLSPTHQDALQTRLAKMISAGNQVYGHFNYQSTRTDNPNLFGFLDSTALVGINTGANWSHRLNARSFLNLGYQYSRFSTRATPFFAYRENFSADAGISGNNQDPTDWGPPTLDFSTGIASLSDGVSSFDRTQTSGASASLLWNHGSHNITFGGDLRRQQFNYMSQQNPRGAFTFTGAQTGSDFADFLLGIPTTSSIAFGNADKYFRESVYDAYFTDDWRINSACTLNGGLRWDYGAPMTELYGRLVNLDIVPGFSAVAPVIAADPKGQLTGQSYPDSLVQPYKGGFSPRIGIAWHPVAASSLIIRAGYGVYYDTSVYQSIAQRMAQQPPLSKTSNVQSTAATPLTLANGFNTSPASASNTFAVDPNFRPGYAQNWQLSIQRDLPGSLQLTLSYFGIKGTHAIQAILPNTFPIGAVSPCPSCPSGFTYLASNGNSSREAAQVQLRRRLRSGLTAILEYSYSKAIDNAAALGGHPTAAAAREVGAHESTPPATGSAGLAIAQNWLDLGAERGLSAFDQRHLFTGLVQYTTGMGLGGGTLLNGWEGRLFQDWTFASGITAGTGLPQTPIYLAPVPGTGITGTIRPDYAGAPLYSTTPGRYVNPGGYTAPQPGYWGNAGRNSITGPSQFLINASLGRTFRLNDRLNLDLRVDAVNALNRVNFSAWNTIINSMQFGLPASANAMRSIQTTLRLRF